MRNWMLGTLLFLVSTPAFAVDDDGDGYDDTVDCDDSNPDVNPGAAEECNDGIDNDCDGQIDEQIASLKAHILAGGYVGKKKPSEPKKKEASSDVFFCSLEKTLLKGILSLLVSKFPNFILL